MNLFNIDYLNKTSVLLKEAFSFKKYKAMHPAFAIAVGIIMIPFVLFSLFVTVFLALLSFTFKTLKTPIDFMHSLMREEGQNVKHATQFIIYLVSWPLIFFLYAISSFLILQITLAYALLSLTAYIWTLGGFKRHLFVSDYSDISIEVNGKYRCLLPTIFLIVSGILLIILPAIHGTVHYISLWVDYREHLFSLDFYDGYCNLSLLFSAIYSFVVFAPNPKPTEITQDNADEAESEETEEFPAFEEFEENEPAENSEAEAQEAEPVSQDSEA